MADIKTIPWEQNGAVERGITLITVGDRVSVELTGSLTNKVPDSEVEDVAALILAAPRLFAALNGMMKLRLRNLDDRERAAVINEAIDALEMAGGPVGHFVG